jgi:hypothetical protein
VIGCGAYVRSEAQPKVVAMPNADQLKKRNKLRQSGPSIPRSMI